MAEKLLQPAPNDYISVVVNFRNLRFMTLINENYHISDLIKEAENTLAKLCSVKVKIKTLKNSVNAVLPAWYPVVPLVRNNDELYAFTDNTAEELNINLTKSGSTTDNGTSPVGSAVLPDSGFTSPVVKPGTSRELQEQQGQEGINKDRIGKQGVTGDDNFSQEELLSEIFSLKDHSKSKAKISQTKHEKTSKFRNRNKSDEGRVVSSEVENVGPGEVSKIIQNNEIQEHRTNSPHNLARCQDSLEDNHKKVVVDGNCENVKKLKEKAKTLDEKSSSESSDDSESDESDNEKKKKIHKDYLLDKTTKSKLENNSERKKTLQPSQNKESVQKLNIKRKKGFHDAATKLPSDNSILNAAVYESDSSEDSTDEDVDETKTGNKKEKRPLSLRKKAKVLEENGKRLSHENMDVDVRSVTSVSQGKSALVLKNKKAASSSVKTRTKESESESDITVEEEGAGRNQKLYKKSIADAQSKKLGSGKEIMSANNEKEETVKNIVTDESKGDVKKIDKSKLGEKSSKSDKASEESSSDSSSSDSSDTDSDNEELLKKQKNNNKLKSPLKNEGKIMDITNMTQEKSKTDVENDISNEKADSKMDLSSISESSWSSSEDEDEDVNATNIKTKKDKNELDGYKNKGISSKNYKPVKDKGKEQGEQILKDGKKKQGDNLDDDTAVARLPTNETQPNNPKTPLKDPRTASTSSNRKSAAMMSASKVASWLLSNPISENIDEATSSETKSPQKMKTRSKRKIVSKTDETTNNETLVNSNEKSKSKTKEDVVNAESMSQTVDDEQTQEESQSQKRKVEEESELDQSTKAKKNKKKKVEVMKNEKQINKDKQQKTHTQTPVATKKGKNTRLSLPKASLGLSALADDESESYMDYSKKSKKQKFSPPAISRQSKLTGFLTPANNVQTRTNASKTPKSRIKRISSSQPSKTVELNAREQEFLENGDMNLETLLNHSSIKW